MLLLSCFVYFCCFVYCSSCGGVVLCMWNVIVFVLVLPVTVQHSTHFQIFDVCIHTRSLIQR